MLVFASRNVLLVFIASLLFSCSWVTSKRSLFGGETESSTAENVPKEVTKEQYDELLAKYETLRKERQAENIKNPTEIAAQEGGSSSNLMEDLQAAKLKSELAETVDVFGKEIQPSIPMGVELRPGDAAVEEQIKQIKMAESDVGANKIDSAMVIIKSLEKSPVPQVRARAKMLLGDVLLKQNEYDLAMQVYEDIIRHEAHSGVVLKVLGKLILCTEKLKQDQKKEQYFSMLHDFFEEEM